MNKTLLISEIFPPTHGGSGRWFWELYSRLPRTQYTIVAGNTADAAEFDKTHELDVIRVNLSSTSWGIKSVSGLKYYWRMFWFLHAIIKQKGIAEIHCGRCLPEGVLGLLLSKWFGIPFICYIHGEDVEAAATSRELSWIVGNVLNSADKLICNSKNTASLLSQWHVNTDTIDILHPGVDSSRFIPADRCLTTRDQLGWQDRPVILTVGRLQKRKGQDMLIRSLPAIKQHIPNVLYAVIGGGEELVFLQSLVAELELQDHVLFMNEVNDDTMLYCYQQCDVFILPNRTVNQDIEGFGMVLVEAQSCSKPVIAGDSGGTKETMLIGQSGFVIDCTQEQHISEKLVHLLESPELCTQMGQQGRQHVVDTLDWQAHTEKAKTLFNVSGS